MFRLLFIAFRNIIIVVCLLFVNTFRNILFLFCYLLLIFATIYDIIFSGDNMENVNVDKSAFAHRFAAILSDSAENTYTLATKLGLTPATISRYTNGKMTPKVPTVYSIANIFNVNPLWLMGYDVSREVTPKRKSIKIPVLGLVRAGIPMDAVEYIIDYEEIGEEMARQGEFFALKIKGDSMEPRISDGDVVIVRKQEDVDSGSIAIVLVNGNDATIKKIQKFAGGIMLVPNNPAYDVLTYTNKEISELPVQIIGKVVELRAKF